MAHKRRKRRGRTSHGSKKKESTWSSQDKKEIKSTEIETQPEIESPKIFGLTPLINLNEIIFATN